MASVALFKKILIDNEFGLRREARLRKSGGRQVADTMSLGSL